MDPIARIMLDKLARAVVIAKLDEAKALITKGWCQRHIATSRVGMPRWSGQNGAVNFCVLGAVMQVTRDDYDTRRVMRLALVQALPLPYRKLHALSDYNDHSERTHEEVIALFDAAIANVNNGNIAGPSNDEKYRLDPSRSDQLREQLAASRPEPRTSTVSS